MPILFDSFWALKMMKRGCGGSSEAKLCISLGLLVGVVIDCSDNTGAKELYIISVKGIKGWLNRLPAAWAGDTVTAWETRTKRKCPSSSGNSIMKVILKKRWGVSLF